ncbi:MAG: ABC transporter transmembrane domain-containing protein, partial [Gaiellaceae bacterium]
MSSTPYRRTFVRLLGFLRPYTASMVVSVALAAGSQALALVLIFLTRAAIPAIRKGEHSRLWLIVAAFVLIGLVKAAMMIGRRLISGKQALAVEMDLRRDVYAKLVRLSFRFYDRHQTGQLMSRATVDLQGVRFFLGYGLIFFFQHLLTVLGVTIAMVIVDWRLALISFAITPILIAVAYRYSHVSHPLLRDVQQKLADVAT